MKQSKLVLFLMAIILPLLITSCLDDGKDDPVNIIKLPSKMTFKDSSDNYDEFFEYNRDNLLTKLTRKDLVSNELLAEYIFVYDTEDKLKDVFDQYGNKYKYIYEQGKITEMYERGGGEVLDGDITTFFLNSKNQIIRVKKSYGSTYYTYDETGNVLEESWTWGQDSGKYKFEYDHSRGVFSNVQSPPVVFFSYLDCFLKNNNVVKQIDVDEDLVYHVDYTYDSEGYPITANMNGITKLEFEYIIK